MDTIKIKHSDDEGNDHMIINKADYDPDKHELFDTDQEVDDGLSDEDRELARKKEAERKYEANRGIPAGGPTIDGRNPSGTYSEPTPTDIRYPDKDATEFENNHGAFLGKSAAGLRDELGMDDKPGGLRPEVHAAVQGAELASNAAADLAATKAPELGEAGIPDDWADLHHKTQMKLAKQISGTDVTTAEEARTIIQAEVDQRASQAKTDADAKAAAAIDPAV